MLEGGVTAKRVGVGLRHCVLTAVPLIMDIHLFPILLLDLIFEGLILLTISIAHRVRPVRLVFCETSWMSMDLSATNPNVA
jgi:hypothetical protein